MKLAQFMKLARITDADLAARIGRERSSVTRWRLGQAFPSWAALAALAEATDGAVTANDFVPTRDEVQS